MVLHCNGVMGEMLAVMSQTPTLAGKALQRANAALARLDKAATEDETALRDAFASHLADVA